MANKKNKIFLVVIFSLAVASAVFWSSLYPQGRPPRADACQYHELAISIVERGELGSMADCVGQNPSMYREPGYPLFVGISYAVFGKNVLAVLIPQTLLYGLSAVLLFLLLLNITNPAVAGLASAMYALFPQMAYRAGYLGTDFPFAVVLIIFLWFLCLTEIRSRSKWNYFLSGALAGILPMIRAIALLLPLPVLLYFSISRRSNLVTKSCLFLLGFLLIVSPWMIRNKIYFDTISLSNRGGVTLHTRASHLDLQGRDYLKFLSASFLGDYITGKFFDDYSSQEKPFIDGTASRHYEVNLKQSGIPLSEVDKKLIGEAVPKILSHPFRYLADFAPAIARLNAPIIPRASSQALLFESKRQIPEYQKLMIILGLRITMYVFLLLVVIGAVFKTKQALGGSTTKLWILLALTLLYFNLFYGALAPIERFSTPLYPFYFLFFIEGLKRLYILTKNKGLKFLY